MPAVPSSLSRRLYVPGSLRNTETGFQFSLCNTLAPGTVTRIGPVVVDGVEYPPERITVVAHKHPRSALQISNVAPFPFSINEQAVLQVKSGQSLDRGRHDLVISVLVKEVGDLEISTEDAIE